MQRDEPTLLDIAEAVRAVQDFVQGMDKASFLKGVLFFVKLVSGWKDIVFTKVEFPFKPLIRVVMQRGNE